ncbi:MAG: glycerol-3-phosphate dehydrogenase [Gammaproteobacteria bacterium]|nr:glycerol-3-phosphate dehydrogenase [Gammaproteobacteria bacterium]
MINTHASQTLPLYDIFIIGGGVNGCGIARDAAGRGLSVALAEKDDLAQGTSSASTKLFHGGLRYLEFYQFSLVRQALKEREVLLHNMPHISWPMRFVLPHVKGIRPAWLVRLGLFIYDHLGGRKLLPATRTLKLRHHVIGQALKPNYNIAFEYSDCWVQDARLVALNAQDAAALSAHIMTRAQVVNAVTKSGLWHITLLDSITKQQRTVSAKTIINASGPWINQVIEDNLGTQSEHKIRLVRGSHIVVKRLFEHDRAYFFQSSDQRIAFAIPYEEDYTLIGTTDQDHPNAPETAVCSATESDYLLALANEYFAQPITHADIVWTYSGVRPLFDDGASKASEATRDYVVSLNQTLGAPLINIFGGKITTYRKLAETALKPIKEFLPHMGKAWTDHAPLPGGNFLIQDKPQLQEKLERDYVFLTPAWAKRLINTYGTNATVILNRAQHLQDLGIDFGHTLTQAEVTWLRQYEFAMTAEDILWRRTKLGLKFSAQQSHALGEWLNQRA